MKLGPFNEVLARANEHISKSGATVLQQFQCAKCGVKNTMDVPNNFYVEGTCGDCGHVTNIEQDGCNYMLMLSNMSPDELYEFLDTRCPG